ncbi:MAG: prepilin-type N-terminal cleavage/methylation domain-containing protein [Gammaproteobacteria bacterium]|nr:prepilin-type N-terminal cleavage/methylation domain-containing protein [Gammaproteobacteria bacterium]
MPTHRHSNSGFTLIEVLLALALTATLLALLSSAVFLVASDWNRDSNTLDEQLDRSLALLQIERALHGAFPHSWLDGESLTRLVYFQGGDEALSWVSTVSPQRRPGLAAWRLFNDEDEGVALQLAPAFTDNPQERLEAAEASLLLPGYRASFQYLYTELDDSRQWVAEWFGDERQELPLAVHVLLEPLPRHRQAEDGQVETREILARIRNNRHRSIQPNAALQGLQ